MRYTGKAHVLGDAIDTDQIFPGKYLHINDWDEFGNYALEGYSDEYPDKIDDGDILVAGQNFGLGSSRESAPVALKNAGFSAIIAESFARIFYRNAINNGLPIIEVPDITHHVTEGDVIEIDMEATTIENTATGQKFTFTPLPPELLEILEAGGVKQLDTPD